MVCFSVMIWTMIRGLTLSHFSFDVVNASNGSGTPVALGPSANVTARNVSGTATGVWYFSNDSWSTGSSAPVAPNSNVSFVLDTDLFSYDRLGGVWFEVQLLSPDPGRVGFSLYDPGTGSPN
jgi:hypothetical protein